MGDFRGKAKTFKVIKTILLIMFIFYAIVGGWNFIRGIIDGYVEGDMKDDTLSKMNSTF